jgi:hypothetical protein
MGVVAGSPTAHFEDCRVPQTLPGVHLKPVGHLRFDYSLPFLHVETVRAFLQPATPHSEPIDPQRSSVFEPTIDLDWLFGPQSQWTLRLHGCCSNLDWYDAYSPWQIFFFFLRNNVIPTDDAKLLVQLPVW